MIGYRSVQEAAFIDLRSEPLILSSNGPLSGLQFAVKDLFDIAEFRTACGNRDRLRDAEPSSTTATVVAILLESGAALIGKTHTDELACGMFGANQHFGIPINPRAPSRVPGGSSSGSASAVAANLCDFAVGTDTGGSIRVPASFCGLFGIRTSHGRLSTAGVMAMAPSFDAIGWLARDADVLEQVGCCFFGKARSQTKPRFLIARDAFGIPKPELGETLLSIARTLNSTEIDLYEEGVDVWTSTFRALQLYDLWSTLGHWATRPGRILTDSVRERFELAASVKVADVAAAVLRRNELARRLHDLLGDDGVLVTPTTHDLPPKRDDAHAAHGEFRDRTLALTCVASLARLPQIHMPVGTFHECPIGLSISASPGNDEFLLATASRLAQELIEPKL